MGPSCADQTLTARPQQRQREAQQSGEQVSRPHGGKATEKAGRSFPQHPHGHAAHPLRWEPRQAAPSAAPRPPARPRDPQLPSEGTALPVPGTSLPQRCCRDGPAPPQRAGLQISAAPAPPPDPRRWRRAAVHAGTCSPAALSSVAPAERGARCFGTLRCQGGGTGERAATHPLQCPAPSRFFPFQLSREAIACGLSAQRPPRRCGRPRGPSWVWRSGSMRGAEP